MPLNCTPKIVKMVHFALCMFYHNENHQQLLWSEVRRPDWVPSAPGKPIKKHMIFPTLMTFLVTGKALHPLSQKSSQPHSLFLAVKTGSRCPSTREWTNKGISTQWHLNSTWKWASHSHYNRDDPKTRYCTEREHIDKESWVFLYLLPTTYPDHDLSFFALPCVHKCLICGLQHWCLFLQLGSSWLPPTGMAARRHRARGENSWTISSSACGSGCDHFHSSSSSSSGPALTGSGDRFAPLLHQT